MFNDDLGHISFISESLSDNGFLAQKTINLEKNTINLINHLNHFNILEHMPKLFTITTNNGMYVFNTEILIDTRLVIAEIIKNNSDQLNYHLDIDDERNILRKLESMYQGKTVSFDINDYSILSKIRKTLQIQKFSIDQLLNHDSFFVFESCNPFANPESLKFTMSKDSFNQYLIKNAPKKYIISTNTRKYDCNIFGMLSSAVIRDYFSKNPKTNLFEFDFSDECNDFQLICE